MEKGFRSTRLGLSLRIDRFSRKDIVFLTILRVVLKNNSYRVELPQEFLYIFYLERAVERVVISNNMNRGREATNRWSRLGLTKRVYYGTVK